MAAGDAFLCKRGLQGAYGSRKDVRLLQNLRWMWSVQRAKHCAVIKLCSLEELQYRKFIPTKLGVPVHILKTRAHKMLSVLANNYVRNSNHKSMISLCTNHHPVFWVHKVNRSSGFPLHCLVHNTASHAINQEDSNEATLLMGVCALRHHSQEIRVQVLPTTTIDI